MTDRPDRHVIRALAFDENWRPNPTYRAKVKRAWCDRRQHTMAYTVRVGAYGLWVAWRLPPDRADGTGERWEYDWADQITGYTEAWCSSCRRARDIFPTIARGVR